MMVTLLIVATVIALSALLYVHFEQIALRQNYSVTMDSLKQTGQAASVMAVTASTFAKQLYNDPEVRTLLDFDQSDVMETIGALNRLDAYRATSPFIDSIYVYKGSTGMFFVSSEVDSNKILDKETFYDRGIVNMIAGAEQYPTLQPIPRRLHVTATEDIQNRDEVDCYTFLLYDTLTKRQNRDVIVVNISETQLHKTIDGMMTNADTNAFILNRDGMLVSNSWKYPMMSSLKDQPFMGRILANPEGSGYFVANVDGRRSFVSYSAPDYLGWRYVRMTPYKELTASIERLKTDTALIALAILAVGALISFLLAKRVFSPADKMLIRLKRLESEGRDRLRLGRRELLRGLLFGWERCGAAPLKEKCAECGIGLEAERETGLCLLQIDDYEAFAGKYNTADRELLKFGIANIAEELGGSGRTAAAAVDLGDDRIAVLLQVKETGPSSEAGSADTANRSHDGMLRRTAEEIRSVVRECLRISVSVTVCEPQLALTSAHQLYAKAAEASNHRLFAGFGCLLDADVIDRLKRETVYQYPLHKEKQLLEELMLGRTEQAKALLEEMLRETEHYPILSYRMAVAHLSFNIHNAIETIAANNDIGLESTHTMNGLVETAHRAPTLDQVLASYFALFDELSLRLEEKRSSKHEDVVQRIVDMIRLRYADQELSLDVIAEELGLSAAYIGRLFKKHTLKTILGFITEVRMGKAQELLRTTDAAVGEIAERSGFSNSPYFYKAFKKYHGVSPAEFRRTGSAEAVGSGAAGPVFMTGTAAEAEQ